MNRTQQHTWMQICTTLNKAGYFINTKNGVTYVMSHNPDHNTFQGVVDLLFTRFKWDVEISVCPDDKVIQVVMK